MQRRTKCPNPRQSTSTSTSFGWRTKTRLPSVYWWQPRIIVEVEIDERWSERIKGGGLSAHHLRSPLLPNMVTLTCDVSRATRSAYSADLVARLTSLHRATRGPPLTATLSTNWVMPFTFSCALNLMWYLWIECMQSYSLLRKIA